MILFRDGLITTTILHAPTNFSKALILFDDLFEAHFKGVCFTRHAITNVFQSTVVGDQKLVLKLK